MRTKDIVAGCFTIILRASLLKELVDTMTEHGFFNEDKLLIGIRYHTIDPWPDALRRAYSLGAYFHREDEYDPYCLYDSVPVIELQGRFEADWDFIYGDLVPLATMVRDAKYPSGNALAAIKVEVRPDADDLVGLTVVEYGHVDNRRLLKARHDDINRIVPADMKKEGEGTND